jgi:hypothetical protein
VFHEVPGVYRVSLSDAEARNELGFGIHRHENILVAKLKVIFGPQEPFVFAKIGPQFVYPNQLARQLAHALV